MPLNLTHRLMVGLPVKSGYEPMAVETMEAAKDEVANPPRPLCLQGKKARMQPMCDSPLLQKLSNLMQPI